MDLTQLHSDAEELERRMRLQTYPLAIKMIKTKDDIGVIYFANMELNTRVRCMIVRQMLGHIFLKKADRI